MKYDFAVIGAGASGIVTALVLAGSGMRVALVERAQRLAPMLRGFKRQGHHLDSGFHYAGGLGPEGILSVYFRYLGVERDLEVDPKNVQDTLRITPPGEAPSMEWAIPCDMRLPARLMELFPQEKQGISEYFDALRREFGSTPFLNLQSSGQGERSRFQDATLARVLKELVRDQGLRRILALPHFYYGMTPERVLFSDHARYSGAFYQGTRRIRGGGAALIRACEKALDRLGVDILTGRKCTSLETSAAGILEGAGLEDGETVPCKGCVVTAHPRIALDIAPKGTFRPSYVARIAALRETPSAWMLFGVTTERIHLLERGGLHLATGLGFPKTAYWQGPREERQMFAAVAGSAAPKSREGARIFGVILPAAFDEVKAWDSGAPGHRPEEYVELKERVAELIAARLHAEVPELEGRWRKLEMAGPLTFKHYSGSPRGSLYGVQHCHDDPRILPQTRLQGLYLSGQAIAGPGVLGATVSAFATCGRILGRDRLLEGVRKCV